MPQGKMGRPKTDNPKSIQVSARLNSETVRKLEESAQILKLSKADTIRLGIEKVYEDVKK